jgi:hypothetical protein
MNTSNPSKCCDNCDRADHCSETVKRCINDSPDCDHCRECKCFVRAQPTEFVRMSKLMARG